MLHLSILSGKTLILLYLDQQIGHETLGVANEG